MTLYNWLSLLGVPAVFGALTAALIAQAKSARRENKALKAGIQALLRAQMISDFNKWSDKGCAPIYARENFENCWRQYHALGANGVMDDVRSKFLALPASAPVKKETGKEVE